MGQVLHFKKVENESCFFEYLEFEISEIVPINIHHVMGHEVCYIRDIIMSLAGNKQASCLD